MARIYVVDDHELIRDGLRAMLAGSEHDVVGEAADVATALREIDTLSPDVLLLDLDLGGVSGLQILLELQRRRRPIRSLVLTGSTRHVDVAEALRRGAAGYLLKDSGRAELRRAVNTVLGGRSYLGEKVAHLAADALADGSTDPIADLSVREHQILVRVVHGDSSAVIGRELSLSPKTVDTYRSRLMRKLGVSDVTALVRLAVRHGLIDR